MSEETDELKDSFDLEQYLDNQGVEYKKGRGSSGVQLNLKECPTCANRKWKVYLNADSGLGNCFSCDQHFNKISFIHAYTGFAWKDVFKVMREQASEQGWRPKSKIVVAVDHGDIKLPLSLALPTPEGQNLIYLEERGFNADVSRYFHLRYCTNGWWNYTKDDGSQCGQKFDDRIIIPIFDLDGVLKTFQGRDVTGNAERKYLFPMGLPGTGRYLFNGQNVLSAKRIAIGEGVFDVAALKLAFESKISLRGVVPVGTFGKHLSFGDITGNDQLGRFIQLKRNGVEEATFMWDGEKKALLAAVFGAEILRKIGFQVRIALLPPGKDPNEISAAEVCAAFEAAQPYSTRQAIQWRLRNPYGH